MLGSSGVALHMGPLGLRGHRVHKVCAVPIPPIQYYYYYYGTVGYVTVDGWTNRDTQSLLSVPARRGRGRPCVEFLENLSDRNPRPPVVPVGRVLNSTWVDDHLFGTTQRLSRLRVHFIRYLLPRYLR